MTISYSKTRDVEKVTVSLVTDSSGDATETTTPLSGTLRRAIYSPTSMGSSTDLTVQDENGISLVNKAGIGNVKTQIVPSALGEGGITDFQPAIDDALTVTIAKGGAVKSCEVVMYVEHNRIMG